MLKQSPWRNAPGRAKEDRHETVELDAILRELCRQKIWALVWAHGHSMSTGGPDETQIREHMSTYGSQKTSRRVSPTSSTSNRGRRDAMPVMGSATYLWLCRWWPILIAGAQKSMGGDPLLPKPPRSPTFCGNGHHPKVGAAALFPGQAAAETERRVQWSGCRI